MVVAAAAKAKQSGLLLLEDARRELLRGRAARAAYERIPGHSAVKFETILHQEPDALEPDDMRETRVDLKNGWIAETKMLSYTPINAYLKLQKRGC